MSGRFTIRSVFLVSALAAAVAGAARFAGPDWAFSFVLALGGLCPLVRSDSCETVRNRVFLICAGLGLWAADLLKMSTCLSMGHVATAIGVLQPVIAGRTGRASGTRQKAGQCHPSVAAGALLERKYGY